MLPTGQLYCTPQVRNIYVYIGYMYMINLRNSDHGLLLICLRQKYLKMFKSLIISMTVHGFSGSPPSTPGPYGTTFSTTIIVIPSANNLVAL